MTIKYPKKYAFILFLLSFWLLPGSNVLFAGEEVMTDDGREVLLNSDGTWLFRSTDRYANTKDGRRVKLKEDGSWEYVEHSEPPAGVIKKGTGLDIKLQNVVVEKHEKKVHKNVRLKSQTVFIVSLGLASAAKNNINIASDDVSRIEVKDNKDREYPVLTVQAGTSVLQPGTDTTIQVRVEGSPKWLDKVKSMELTLKPGIFGLQKAVTLSQDVKYFDTKNVNGFEYTKEKN